MKRTEAVAAADRLSTENGLTGTRHGGTYAAEPEPRRATVRWGDTRRRSGPRTRHATRSREQEPRPVADPRVKGSSEYPICKKLVSPNQVKLTTAPVAVMWGD